MTAFSDFRLLHFTSPLPLILQSKSFVIPDNVTSPDPEPVTVIDGASNSALISPEPEVLISIFFEFLITPSLLISAEPEVVIFSKEGAVTITFAWSWFIKYPFLYEH